MNGNGNTICKEVKCSLSLMFCGCKYDKKDSVVKSTIHEAVTEYMGYKVETLYITIEKMQDKEDEFAMNLWTGKPEDCEESFYSKGWRSAEIQTGLARLGINVIEETIKILGEIQSVTLVLKPAE